MPKDECPNERRMEPHCAGPLLLLCVAKGGDRRGFGRSTAQRAAGDHTSWLRTSRSSLLSSRKARVTSGPKATPTPRLFGLRPLPGWGSLHSSSHISPSSGGCLQSSTTGDAHQVNHASLKMPASVLARIASPSIFRHARWCARKGEAQHGQGDSSVQLGFCTL